MRKQSNQEIADDPKTESQKLKKEQLKEASGGSYTPDAEPKDDDILLPEIE